MKTKIEKLRTIERDAAKAYQTELNAEGIRELQKCRDTRKTWQDALKALSLAEEKAAKKADKKRQASAELITTERDTGKAFDSLKNASKESVFIAVQGASIVAHVATYATKSRTWGYTWRACGFLPHTYRFTGTSASGYGYCKESQAVENWLQYALKGYKSCGGVGMDAAFDAFKDAALISLRLSGKSVNSLKFFKV
jgi:hypothetical protein